MYAYTLIDLFAGCGGMTLGFHDSGRFETVFAVEQDYDAAETYGANFPDVRLRLDPSEQVKRIPRADVLVGGPPCQGFSNLNRNGAYDDRRRLWREYMRVLVQSQAVAFVMENVPRLIGSPELNVFTKRASALGFQIQARTLNAADYGVPQVRKRAIVVGSRLGKPRLPEPTHGDCVRPVRGRLPWRTFRDAVEGLPIVADGRDWHTARVSSAESLRRYQAVPIDGGNRFQMVRELEQAGLAHLVPAHLKRRPERTMTDVYGRLWWDRPSVTIRTEFYKPDKGRYLHPSENRPITLREAARLMGFPDDYVIPGSHLLQSAARQVGNACPPPLACSVAVSLAGMLDRSVKGFVAGLDI